MKTILFLCVANSARSQLAEGLAKSMFKDKASIMSAGSEPSGKVHPQAVEALREIGIDISANTSKPLGSLPLSINSPPDYVITLCTEEVCPIYITKSQRLHWPIPDPAGAPDVEKPKAFRAARVKIKMRLEIFCREQGLM